MRKLEQLKLNSLSKADLKEREMDKLYGGNYCATAGANQTANGYQGLCSCNCMFGLDYYTTRNEDAAYMKKL